MKPRQICNWCRMPDHNLRRHDRRQPADTQGRCQSPARPSPPSNHCKQDNRTPPQRLVLPSYVYAPPSTSAAPPTPGLAPSLSASAPPPWKPVPPARGEQPPPPVTVHSAQPRSPPAVEEWETEPLYSVLPPETPNRAGPPPTSPSSMSPSPSSFRTPGLPHTPLNLLVTIKTVLYPYMSPEPNTDTPPPTEPKLSPHLSP